VVNDEQRKKAIRRTALLATGVALAFYIGFIMVGVLNA